MSKRINTYDDMLKEKEQLEVLLKAQAELVRYDFAEVRNAAIDSVASVGKVLTRNTGNILLMGTANRLIDTVVKKGILGRAGWFTKMVVPFLIKNYSSHYIVDHQKQWISKLFWIGKNTKMGMMLRLQHGRKIFHAIRFEVRGLKFEVSYGRRIP